MTKVVRGWSWGKVVGMSGDTLLCSQCVADPDVDAMQVVAASSSDVSDLKGLYGRVACELCASAKA